MKEIIHSEKAPGAIGPYSQATRVGKLLFCSGQIGIDPATGEMVTGDIRVETRQVLDNLYAVLDEAGAGWADVVKTTVYLDDLGQFTPMNEVYATIVGDDPPARATVEVARLPRDARVEIDLIAVIPESR